MPPKKTTLRPPRQPSTNWPFRRPVSAILYGPSGNGKSSLAAHFPGCRFLCDSQERGISYLLDRGLVPEPVVEPRYFDADDHRSWNQILTAVSETVVCPHTQTLVLESITGFENVCFLHHCEAKFRGNFDGTTGSGGFFDYQRGPKSAARLEIPKLISALDAVMQSGKNVILTGHSNTKEETDPQGTSVLKYVPYCDKDTWARLHRWASMVFFLGRKIEEDKENKSLRKVAKDKFDRLLFLEGTPYCEAKNWFGVHGVVHMGHSGQQAYDNLMKAFNK